MARKFSIMDIMNEASREEAEKGAGKTEKVSVHDIQPNEDNFYRPCGIEQLKNSIYAMGGVQQNLILARLPDDSRFKYKALAGHRRIYACLELVKEGHAEFEFVPAVIKENIDKDTENALLIMTNSTQRELTDWEKVMQHMKLKEIIPKLKKRQGLDGKTRVLEADYLGVSEGQIAIYNTIGTRLNAWLMEWFKMGNIGISLAYESAKLETEQQEKLVEIAKNKGNFTENDIRLLMDSCPIRGQLKISGDSGNAENVSDSDTFMAEAGSEEEKTDTAVPAVKKAEVISLNAASARFAVGRIFDSGEFPKDKLNELINALGSANRIGSELVFDRMLPYENSRVRVMYVCGYKVEFIQENKVMTIPIHYFWKAFEEYYAESCQNQAREEQLTVPDILKSEKIVTESDTIEPHPATGQEDRAEIKTEASELRGGYDAKLIDILIVRYEKKLKSSIEEKEMKMIYEYRCLLDALDLLKKEWNGGATHNGYGSTDRTGNKNKGH